MHEVSHKVGDSNSHLKRQKFKASMFNAACTNI